MATNCSYFLELTSVYLRLNFAVGSVFWFLKFGLQSHKHPWCFFNNKCGNHVRKIWQVVFVIEKIFKDLLTCPVSRRWLTPRSQFKQLWKKSMPGQIFLKIYPLVSSKMFEVNCWWTKIGYKRSPWACGLGKLQVPQEAVYINFV